MNDDMTRCDAVKCPLKDTCDRFVLINKLPESDPNKPVFYSYFMSMPYENDNCEYFVEKLKTII